MNKKTLIFKFKTFILELLFPKSCINCSKQETYVCEDCLALIDFLQKPVKIPGSGLIYCACDYRNIVIRKLIQKFKQPPFAKDLAKVLASLIIIYLYNLEKKPDFLSNKQDYTLVPAKIDKKQLKRIGYNPSEEIAKHLSGMLRISLKEKNGNKNRILVFDDPKSDYPENRNKEISFCFTISEKKLLVR